MYKDNFSGLPEDLTWSDFKESANSYDSDYLQRSLEMLIDDFKRVKEEKHMVPILKWVMDRLNQSYPSGDVTKADVKELVSEPSARSALKKSKMSKDEVVDMVFDI